MWKLHHILGNIVYFSIFDHSGGLFMQHASMYTDAYCFLTSFRFVDIISLHIRYNRSIQALVKQVHTMLIELITHRYISLYFVVCQRFLICSLGRLSHAGTPVTMRFISTSKEWFATVEGGEQPQWWRRLQEIEVWQSLLGHVDSLCHYAHRQKEETKVL